MAYIDRGTNPRHRAATAIAVVALEAAAVLAVVNGLTVTFLPKPEEPGLAGEQIDLPKPPPAAEAHRDDTQRTDPLRDADRTHDEEIVIVPSGGGVLPFDDAGGTTGTGGSDTFRDPPPKPPAFIPRAATPRNAPGLWATPSDYPARDLREGNQGVTRFRLAIGSDGRVTGCAVIASSGFPSLDAATCDKVSRRARFDPATDETGARVPGSYSGSIRWVIPE